MDSALVHSSHDLRENGSERYPEGHPWAGGVMEYGVDPHTTGWYCARCHAYTCELCKEGDSMDDDELRAECPGIPWYEVQDSGDEVAGERGKRAQVAPNAPSVALPTELHHG